MTQFNSPKKSFGALDADSAAAVISAATDVAVVVDPKGKILDFSSSEAFSASGARKAWVGKSWADTVTVESRVKIEELLEDAGAKATPRWRQINYPSDSGPDRPVLYCAIQVGDKGHVVGLGRDMSQIAGIQQRLIDAQRSLEEHYARIREVETQFQLLFQNSPEAILTVDASTDRVLDVNRAGEQMLEKSARRLVGQSVLDTVGKKDAAALQALLEKSRQSGEAEGSLRPQANGEDPMSVAVSHLRQDSAEVFILRISLNGARPLPPDSLSVVAEHAPEAIVFTDGGGRIRRANPAFLAMAQLSSEQQAIGESIDTWLGRSGVDFNVLTTNVRAHGKLEHFATTVRGQLGAATDVEISAAPVSAGDVDGLGFLIRNVGHRATPRLSRPNPPNDYANWWVG